MRLRALLLTLLLSTGIAHAEPLKLTVFDGLYGRINPLGIENWLYVGLQGPLYDARHAALANNFVYLSALVKLSPSSLKVGPWIELQPLSILHLRFQAEIAQWFGVFTTFQSFASPLDVYSDSAMYKLASAGTNYATTSVHLGFAPRLQVQFGPIVIRDETTVDWYSANVRPGDTVFYETNSDTLAEPNNIVISNTADVLWSLPKQRLYVGFEHVLFQPFYSARAYRPGEPHDNPNGNQRLVAMGVWTFFKRPTKAMTLILQAGWYLQHRYRTGVDTNAGIPYLLGGLVITGDWPR